MSNNTDGVDDRGREDEDEGVGYGRPPKKNQWQKGQSGNPKGRKKGSRGLKTDLHQELSATLAITIAGKKVTGTTQQLMLRTLAARAASGNIQAARVLIDLTLQIFGSGDRGEARQALSVQDQELLDRLLAGEIDVVTSLPARDIEPADPAPESGAAG